MLRRNAIVYFANPGNVPFSNGLAGNANTTDWAIFAGVTIFYNLSPRDERYADSKTYRDNRLKAGLDPDNMPNHCCDYGRQRRWANNKDS